jgi:hypothetical protein
MNSTIMSPFGGYSDSNDTSLVFSPSESFKPARGDFSAAARVAGLSDPFTTSQQLSQSRPSAGLNAAASSFKPTIPDRREGKSAAADTFGVNYLANVIATNEQPAANQFSQSGMFTRDTFQSRVLKVTCLTDGSAVASIQNYVQVSGCMPNTEQSD